MSDPIIPLVLVGLISITCQFLAYKIKLPAILPLLVAGVIVGPVTGLIDPDLLFGELLFPIVSLSVAIILFEGSLTLKLKDISGHGSMVRNLCTYGALITWVIVAPFAHFALGMSWQMAFLFGAIVTVTGPTVIVPMLRTVRPSSKISNILRWEGIIIDRTESQGFGDIIIRVSLCSSILKDLNRIDRKTPGYDGVSLTIITIVRKGIRPEEFVRCVRHVL